ncbi:MAG: 50S ribosomal protein L32, partial [Fibrobacterales bacterium]
RDKRRTNWKLKTPTASKWPQCGSTKEPHRVCNNCGYYGEKEIFSPDDI